MHSVKWILSIAAGKSERSRNNCYGNHVMGLKKIMESRKTVRTRAWDQICNSKWMWKSSLKLLYQTLFSPVNKKVINIKQSTANYDRISHRHNTLLLPLCALHDPIMPHCSKQSIKSQRRECPKCSPSQNQSCWKHER